MQSVTTTAFILIIIIKKDFDVIADIRKSNFDILINLSNRQYNGMCSTIVIQCTDSIGMISIISSTISHLHITNINDWKCLERIDKCFLNAQLSSPFMPLALIVNITNADNYIGLSCETQKPFTIRKYQIKIFVRNCLKKRLKRSVPSKSVGMYHNESIRNSLNYATIHKIVCFLIIPGIAGYCITIYLIFCIILAQHERIQQYQTSKEVEFYKQSSGEEIKKWITNVANSMKVGSLSKRQSSDLTSSELMQQLPKKRVAQNLSSASLTSLKMAQEDQRQPPLKYSSRRSEIKRDFRNRNKTKRLPRKIAKRMEINISKKSESPNKSSWIRFRKENLRSPAIATSVSRKGAQASLPMAKRSSNESNQAKIEERQGREKFETFSRPTRHVTTPHKRIRNWQPYLQRRILKRETATNRLDTQEMSGSSQFKTIPSPQPMVVQVVYDIPSDVEIPSRRMHSQSCIIPIQQSNLICERKNAENLINRRSNDNCVEGNERRK
ncbi:Muscle M-line assembly protein [Dirofilaria immitis]